MNTSMKCLVYHSCRMTGVHTNRPPYQECSESEYESLKDLMPKTIDWSKLSEYEQEDNTSGMQTMACSGDVCEIVDLT